MGYSPIDICVSVAQWNKPWILKYKVHFFLYQAIVRISPVLPLILQYYNCHAVSLILNVSNFSSKTNLSFNNALPKDGTV